MFSRTFGVMGELYPLGARGHARRDTDTETDTETQRCLLVYMVYDV